MVALSPAYSEPQMHAWERSFDGHMRLLNQKHDGTIIGADDDDDDMDMFMVSSSARPFHGGGGVGVGVGGRGVNMKIGGSQFNAQCHTWPTSESEFSWSQIQVSDFTRAVKGKYMFLLCVKKEEEKLPYFC